MSFTTSERATGERVSLVCDCPSLAIGLQNVVVSGGMVVSDVTRRLEQLARRDPSELASVLLIALISGIGPRAEELLWGPFSEAHRVLLLPPRGVVVHSKGLGLSATGTVVLPLSAGPRQIVPALRAAEPTAGTFTRSQIVGPGGELSTREQEVLRRLADGATNREIAKWMVVTENTVKSHLGAALPEGRHAAWGITPLA